jgi:alkanesulfonate monooxygenase SsuD/methylene tetrahydromethanopterin reductase-like flavin-dependent oxidoreductase (luciferase family)
MTEPGPRRLLVVANRTESASQLLDEVGNRAGAGCQIALMVPPERNPEAPDWTPDEAHRLVERAAGGHPVTLVDCGDDAAATIAALAERGECDEILLSTQREHHEHWHRHSLPKRIQDLGIPVTAIPPDATGWSYSHGFPPDWIRPEAGRLM